ncbi:MAG TPA: prolyl oligopeptidase family serine peptidase, partial [Rubricoccaceae bacterium]
MLRPLTLCALFVGALPAMAQSADDDPFRWLEDVEGDSAMAWVEAHNASTLAELGARPEYDDLYRRSLAILTSDDRIAAPEVLGDRVYNFWTDAGHPRGVWRRTAWDEYLDGAPAWETVLDLGALGAAEGVNWAWGGATCLEPDYRRCLVRLSRGGADATEVREFDTETRRFVDGGFALPEAKSSMTWVDEDTVLLSTDFGEGSMTPSGYPRVVKRWARGTPLAAAETVFEAAPTDMGAWAFAFVSGDRRVAGVAHRPSFFEATYHVLHDGALVPLDLPLDAEAALAGDHFSVQLRSEWTVGGRTHTPGTVLALRYEDFLDGGRDFETVFVPGPRQTVQYVTTVADDLLVSTLDDVRGSLHRFRYDDGRWTDERVDAPDFGSVSVASVDDDGGRFFFTYSSFLQPSTLYLAEDDGAVRPVHALPAQFDAAGLVVTQREATSPDGTRVPYFLVHREGAAFDGTAPTLLYGYGGFEVSLQSAYDPITGAAWLERGGVYAVANIRGGGEFGPAWHRAAMRENRPRAYEDFIAVAEALISTGVTSPAHLGIRGGSNGGLLMGAMLTQRPDLFNAVVVQVPLLDMLRYHRLLAGASWMAEYGDPDVPADRDFIARYSPYQNLRAGAAYPVPLFTT